jgi:hypothetical protein
MTPRENFKFGFLARCAEEGLDADGARDRALRGLMLVKAAEGGPLDVVWGGVKGLGSAGATVARHLGGLALLGGVATPALIGGAAGLGLAGALEHEVDPTEVRNQELIAAYNYHADQARRRALFRALSRPQRRSR